VNVTVTVPETSAEAGTLRVAVPAVRLEPVNAVDGEDAIALTLVNVVAVSATVVVPAGTEMGAVQSPVPIDTGVAAPLIVNEYGPVTAGVPDRLQISMKPVEAAAVLPGTASAALAVAAVAALLANEGAANSNPAASTARSTVSLFMCETPK